MKFDISNILIFFQVVTFVYSLNLSFFNGKIKEIYKNKLKIDTIFDEVYEEVKDEFVKKLSSSLPSLLGVEKLSSNERIKIDKKVKRVVKRVKNEFVDTFPYTSEYVNIKEGIQKSPVNRICKFISRTCDFVVAIVMISSLLIMFILVFHNLEEKDFNIFLYISSIVLILYLCLIMIIPILLTNVINIARNEIKFIIESNLIEIIIPKVFGRESIVDKKQQEMEEIQALIKQSINES